MPLIRFIGDVLDRTACILASKPSRFRLAVSCGFVIAAVGVIDIGLGDRPGVAQQWDLFGGGSSFFGQPEPQPLTVRREPRYHPRVRRSSLYDRVARHRVVKPVHEIKVASRPRREPKPDSRIDQAHGGAISVSRISLCVRSCDGFAFPVGAYHGEQDLEAHEATCQAQCPGARTALYVLPAGAGTIGDAIDVKSGQAYSALPRAFHYTTVLSESCSCHETSGIRIASLLHDYTLRRGDAVMTKHGLQVFHGASHFPFRPRDFVVLTKSRDIRNADRAAFHAIEKASFVGQSGSPEDTSTAADAKAAHRASR